MEPRGLARELRGLELRGRVQQNVPLAEYTAYRVGGPAEVLFEPEDPQDLVRGLMHLHARAVPIHLLGAGSNVLVPDEGLAGVVIRVCDGMSGVRVEGDVVIARAGTSDRTLADVVASRGMTGFEFLEDIPGTIGGGLVQNAEAYGDAISDHLLEVNACTPDGQMRTWRRDQLFFGYRDSTFKQQRDLIIVEARFRPEGRDDPASIRHRMDALRQKRHARYPMDLPNCGSVFKRPAGDYAGRLIEEAGLGGLTVGGARVSRRHHNFIVNTGGATCADIRELVRQVIERVHQCSGVRLERELVYLDDLHDI